MRKKGTSIGMLFLWGFFLVLVGIAVWLFYMALDPDRRTKVVVEWSTASELETVGFNLYRGEDPTGDFIKVNRELIPSAGDALVGSEYRFIDTFVKPGRVYYYMLEDVDTFGNAHRNGPITIKTEAYRWLEITLAVGLLLVVILGMGISGSRIKKP